MAKFCTEFWSGKREFLLSGECIKKSVNRAFIDKRAIRFRREKQIQIKRIFFRFTLDFNTLLQLITNNFGHLICNPIALRQILIGVVVLDITPITLCLLFIRICPVIDGIGRKLVIRQCLERCTGKVQRVIALDLMECHICFGCVHTLVCLVDNQQFPLHLYQFFQLVILTTEIKRAF